MEGVFFQWELLLWRDQDKKEKADGTGDSTQQEQPEHGKRGCVELT